MICNKLRINKGFNVDFSLNKVRVDAQGHPIWISVGGQGRI